MTMPLSRTGRGRDKNAYTLHVHGQDDLNARDPRSRRRGVSAATSAPGGSRQRRDRLRAAAVIAQVEISCSTPPTGERCRSFHSRSICAAYRFERHQANADREQLAFPQARLDVAGTRAPCEHTIKDIDEGRRWRVGAAGELPPSAVRSRTQSLHSVRSRAPRCVAMQSSSRQVGRDTSVRTLLRGMSFRPFRRLFVAAAIASRLMSCEDMARLPPAVLVDAKLARTSKYSSGGLARNAQPVSREEIKGLDQTEDGTELRLQLRPVEALGMPGEFASSVESFVTQHVAR